MLAHANIIEIFTYGGGQGLYDIFNAIASLTNYKGGVLVSFAFLSLIFGTFWGVIHAFFSQKLEMIFLHFAVPACLFWTSLISISTPVLITDILAQTEHKVDNVPYLFALFCSMASELGYTVTKQLESVLHKPNDPQYLSAGLIFGAQTALDFGKYRLTNANLERNLNNFCKKCVFYDLSFGRYALEDLRKAPDIWSFLKDKTSKSRLVDYCEVDKQDKFKAIKCELLSCQNALNRMSDEFSSEKRYYANLDFAKQLPLTFQALTKLKTAGQDLVSQQLMMNVLTNNFPKRFAQERAKSYLTETYLMMGMSFQTGIISIRIVLEAILYLSIIIVIPLAMLPHGLNVIKNWAFAYFWIQMWPPLFVIVNYIFQSYAQADAGQIFAGLSHAQEGLSLYTSVGAVELYKDVLAKCGFAYTLVPMLTFTLLKGGATSFVHLAGSLVQPEQTAASSAANEMLSGNYSFGNVQYGQMQYENTNAFQNNTAPFISDGFFQTNSGDLMQTHLPGRTVLRENLSDLASNVYLESSIGSQLHHSQQLAESQVQTWQQAYGESVAESQRGLHDFTAHLANNDSFSTNYSSREAQTAHEAASCIWNDAEQFASQYNVSSSDVLRGMLGAKLFGTGIETGTESAHGELTSQLKSYSSSEDFQKRLESINDFSKTVSHNELSDEGVRLANSYADSLDKTETYQHNLSDAYSRLTQITQTADSFDQNTFSQRQQMTQEFVDFTYQKCQERNYLYSPTEILTGKNDFLRDDLLSEFSQSYIDKLQNRTLIGCNDPQTNYENSTIPKIDYEQRQHSFADNYKISNGQLAKPKDNLIQQGTEFRASNLDETSLKELSIKRGFDESRDHFDTQKSKYLVEQVCEHNWERTKDARTAAVTYGFSNSMPPDPMDPDPIDIYDPKYN